MSKAKTACGDDTDLSSWKRPLFRFIHFYVRANIDAWRMSVNELT